MAIKYNDKYETERRENTIKEKLWTNYTTQCIIMVTTQLNMM